MSETEYGKKAGEILSGLKEKKPLVHNITNFVVMNWTANILLAAGASPVMAHAQDEVEEMASLSSALVLNIGTLTPYWIDSMILAGKRAGEIGVPILLDPVGSGATRLRTESARRIIDELRLGVIRGNASEILALAKAGSKTKGVDSLHNVDEAAETASLLARELQTTLAITGAVDLVTDGSRILRISNGHELMGYVTGTGCAASALIGAFMAVEHDSLIAAACALAYFGLAGEKAAISAAGPGSFQIAVLDALYNIDSDELAAGARILP